MDHKLIRIAFQFVFLVIFMYQMWNSFLKYKNKPIVQEHSTTKIDSIPEPNIYFCFSDQYNYTKANQYGYEMMKHLYMEG